MEDRYILSILYKDKMILRYVRMISVRKGPGIPDNLFSEYESNYLSYILDDKKYGQWIG